MLKNINLTIHLDFSYSLFSCRFEEACKRLEQESKEISEALHKREVVYEDFVLESAAKYTVAQTNDNQNQGLIKGIFGMFGGK